jgi:separase
MLPLESMPILRKEEVYRMPSVSSIYIALDKMSNYYVPQKNYKRRKDNSYKEEVERNLMQFPIIDPLDTFYLINPSGDPLVVDFMILIAIFTAFWINSMVPVVRRVMC